MVIVKRVVVVVGATPLLLILDRKCCNNYCLNVLKAILLLVKSKKRESESERMCWKGAVCAGSPTANTAWSGVRGEVRSTRKAPMSWPAHTHIAPGLRWWTPWRPSNCAIWKTAVSTTPSSSFFPTRKSRSMVRHNRPQCPTRLRFFLYVCICRLADETVPDRRICPQTLLWDQSVQCV